MRAELVLEPQRLFLKQRLFWQNFPCPSSNYPFQQLIFMSNNFDIINLICQRMLNQRKSWTSEEDQLLIQIFEENKQKILAQILHWNFIAQKLNLNHTGSNRSGKQCRQRWFNQLDPSITKNHFWTEEDKKSLLRLHDLFGNRWSAIAKHFPGRTDNCIKNYMNSTLRKALRLLNLFVSKNRKFKQFKFKNLKEYKVDLVNKLLFLSGSKNPVTHFEQDFFLSTFSQLNKQQILTQVYDLASDIKGRLMWIQSQTQGDQQDLRSRTSYEATPCFEELIEKIHELNGMCKKKKQKKSRKQKFRWKRCSGNSPDTELANFKFHSGPIAGSLQPFTNQTKKQAAQSLQLLIISQKDEQNQSNEVKNEKTQLIDYKKSSIQMGDQMGLDFKLKRLWGQNNGKLGLGKIECQAEKMETVNVKCQEVIFQGKQYKTAQKKLQTNGRQVCSLQLIQPVDFPHPETDKYHTVKCMETKTQPSISSFIDKSKDSNLTDTPNLQYDSDSSMNEEYHYFMLSEYVDDQSYLPLYASYQNEGGMHFPSYAGKFGLVDDGSVSEEEAV